MKYSRWLWNLHQRRKFLKAELSRDILKFRVAEMPFPGVFKRYFSLPMSFCFIRIHARPGTILLRCPHWKRSTALDGSNVSRI